MSLREDGYFEQVSAQLESTVGAQFSDVTDSASENAESGVSPSVNALDVGIKAATAIGDNSSGNRCAWHQRTSLSSNSQTT